MPSKEEVVILGQAHFGVSFSICLNTHSGVCLDDVSCRGRHVIYSHSTDMVIEMVISSCFNSHIYIYIYIYIYIGSIVGHEAHPRDPIVGLKAHPRGPIVGHKAHPRGKTPIDGHLQ